MAFDMYNPIDIIILAIISVGFILGIWKGFVRSLTALASLAFGVVLAIKYYPQVEPHLGKISSLEPHLAMAISMILIFIAVQVVFVLIRRVLAAIVDVTNLSWLDRVLGALMGVFSASLVVAAIVQAVLIGMPESKMVKESKLIQPANEFTKRGIRYLPASSRKQLEKLAEKWKREQSPKGFQPTQGPNKSKGDGTNKQTPQDRPDSPAGNPHLPSTRSQGSANRY
jgi:membrane protein required for colicin V production